MLDNLKQSITLDDLHRLERDGLRVEVIDGEIFISKVTMTLLHALVIQALFRLLDGYVREHRLGVVFMDSVRFRLQGGRGAILRARQPDLAFVRAHRIPAELDLNDDFPIPPDLAVEVISPGQTNAELIRKIAEYLEAGVEEAWLLFPAREELHCYRRDAEAPEIYGLAASLTPDALFPGLVLHLTDILKPGLP